MDPDLRILVVEDVPTNAELEIHRIRAAGIPCAYQRVETEPQLREALTSYRPGLIISDFSLPQFSGLSALAIAAAEAPEVPFIFVSGTIGEERAIEALKQGAVDYLSKPADADVIEAALLQRGAALPPPPEQPMTADRVRWEHIQRVFEQCDRNVSETARRLRMHRRTLQRILSKYAPRA